MSNTITKDSIGDNQKLTSKNRDRRLVVTGDVGQGCSITFNDSASFVDGSNQIKETVITINGKVGANTTIIVDSINVTTTALIITGNIGDNVKITTYSGEIQIDGTIGENCKIETLGDGRGIALKQNPPATCVITTSHGKITVNGETISQQKPPSVLAPLYRRITSRLRLRSRNAASAEERSGLMSAASAAESTGSSFTP